mgnify:CR=1 FL=1
MKAKMKIYINESGSQTIQSGKIFFHKKLLLFGGLESYETLKKNQSITKSILG